MSFIIFFLCFFLLLFFPAEKMSSVISFSLQKWKRRSLLYRGEKMLEWIEGHGVSSYGFHLGESLPERESYKSFGEHIHKLWQSIQKRGGEISVGLRALRLSLRQDIKRTKREHSLLRGAFSQILIMLSLVWIFMVAFHFIGGMTLGGDFFGAVALWQGCGVLFYSLWLRRKRRLVFGPLDLILSGLLEMYFIYFRGGLAEAYLENEGDLRGAEEHLFSKMEQTLEIWRRRGQGQKKQVDELMEDFFFLAEDKEEKFLGQLKLSTFIWSLFFVLIPLFATGLFGLNEMTKL